jgi:hypothetical protein
MSTIAEYYELLACTEHDNLWNFTKQECIYGGTLLQYVSVLTLFYPYTKGLCRDSTMTGLTTFL